jgi:hypothetical protein
VIEVGLGLRVGGARRRTARLAEEARSPGRMFLIDDMRGLEGGVEVPMEGLLSALNWV